ncbi:hypothetical protein GCM10010297_03350 [Streptomyces malachitofuscus]|nr:hypothetical protein GCM10010297_03350 [Streptomyces malachitofuscus]
MDALAEESRLLREHAWPVGAEGPVGDLAAEPAAAEEEWTKAAGAADSDTYIEHTDAGWGVTDPYIAVTARNALGLTDTPPAYDEEAEREPESGDIKV